MKSSKIILTLFFAIATLCFAQQANAQIKIEDLKDLNIAELLGKAKVMKVRKGFSPVFSIGNYQINTVGLLGEKLKGVGILGEILDKRGVEKIMGLYKTYKTGLVVFKILGAAGTAVTVLSAVKGFTAEQNFNDKTVKQLLYPAVASLLTGVITKVLTKKASYKAVDIFNGVVRNKIKDIFSIQPASATLGLGLYVKL